MKQTRMLLVLLVCLMLLSLAGTVVAAPAPPLTAVNEETKECGQMPGGDECSNCYPINGWTQIGDGYDFECPEGYTYAQPEYQCQRFKAQFCCTEDHSGSSGDCEDLIISHRYDQCAFVDDINNCKPPREWTRQPNGVRAWEWLCPAGYEWIDDLDCAGEESSGEESAATATPETSAGTSLPCLGALIFAPALLALWPIVRKIV